MKPFFLFLLFIACYRPIVKEKQDISISLFKNNTKEYGLEEELDLVLTEEIMKDRNFRITNYKGSLILKGCIIDYKKTPIPGTSEYRLNMIVEFEFNDKKERIISSIIYSKKDNEEEEKKRLLRRISRQIINKLYDL